MLTECQRLLIIEKYKNGDTINEIANSMKISHKTVYLWLNKYAINKNVDRKKREYKKCTTKTEDTMILNILEKNNKFQLSAIVNELVKNNIILSNTTVWRRLKENNFYYVCIF